MTTTRKTITTPIINLNGDRAETLLGQINAVHEAIRLLSQAIGPASPHGRNYQCNPEGSYDAARRQHQEHCDALRKMDQFYTDQYLEITDQQRSSGRR